MNGELTIRPARTEDRDQLRKAIVELQESERALHDTRLPGEDVADDYLSWMLHRAEAEGVVLVADVEGQFAGFVAGWIERADAVSETPDSNRFGYVSDICIVPKLRGRRIALRLLAAIEQHFARADIRRVRINTLAANRSARLSYERAGFTPYEVLYEKTVGGAKP